MNIRGAIFDLDGTLTDSMYIWQKARWIWCAGTAATRRRIWPGT